MYDQISIPTQPLPANDGFEAFRPANPALLHGTENSAATYPTPPPGAYETLTLDPFAATVELCHQRRVLAAEEARLATGRVVETPLEDLMGEDLTARLAAMRQVRGARAGIEQSHGRIAELQEAARPFLAQVGAVTLRGSQLTISRSNILL